MLSSLNLSFGLSSPVGCPIGIILTGITFPGIPRRFLSKFIRLSSGYAAVHTAPSPRDSTASSMFSPASEQSIIANSVLPSMVFSGIAQTIIIAPAFQYISELCKLSASVSIFFFSDITINDHGCLFIAVGAHMAHFNILSKSSLLTDSPVKCLTLFLFLMVFITSLSCEQDMLNVIINTAIVSAIFFIIS